MYRIMQVLPCEPDNREYGGPVTLIKELSAFLRAKGCQLTMLAPALRGGPSTGVLHREERAFEDVSVLIYPTWFRYRWSTVNPTAIPFCLLGLKGLDLVVIHCYRTFLGTLASLGAAARGIPYVVVPHGSCHSGFRSRIKKAVYDAAFGHRLLRRSHRVIFNSRGEMNRGGSLVKRAQATIIPHGVSAPASVEPLDLRLRYGFPAQGRILLTLGRINRTKNIPLLLEALRLLPAETCLLVVGPWEEEAHLKRLQQLALAGGIAGRVCFAGPVYGEEKFPLIRGADVLVSTSFVESFGMSIAEALAVGVPAVFPEAAGITEFVAGHPLAFPTQLQKEAVAARIQEALRFGKPPLHDVPATGLEWSVVLERYWELFREAIEERTEPTSPPRAGGRQ